MHTSIPETSTSLTLSTGLHGYWIGQSFLFWNESLALIWVAQYKRILYLLLLLYIMRKKKILYIYIYINIYF